MTETNPLPFHPQADIIDQILKQVKKDKKDYRFPDHVVAQAAFVSQPAGVMVDTALLLKYSEGDHESWKDTQRYVLRESALRLAARAIRFLEEIDSLSNQTIITNDNRTEPSEDLVSQNPERES